MEGNELGKSIGVVGHSFSITNEAGDKVQLSVNIDFSTSSDSDIKTWLVSNRIIAGQRPWRSLSKDELVKLNGTTFIAETIGQKVKSTKEITVAFMSSMSTKSREDLIVEFMNGGLSETKAELMADAILK